MPTPCCRQEDRFASRICSGSSQLRSARRPDEPLGTRRHRGDGRSGRRTRRRRRRGHAGDRVEILTGSGIPAEGASSAAEAEERQAHLSPGVALVDQRLPDGPGVELGSLLKSRDADLTVLLVTGYANLENAIAAVWQVDGYLTKPVPPAELVRVVRSGLETARLRRENRDLVGELQRANRKLEASVEDRTSELSGLVTLAGALAGSSELDDVVDACLHTASEVTGARHAALYLPAGEDDSAFRLRACLGERAFPEELAEHVRGRRGAPGRRPALTAGGGASASWCSARLTAARRFSRDTRRHRRGRDQNAQRFGRERETVERLSELSRMKTTFLGAVSHELRTRRSRAARLAELLAAGSRRRPSSGGARSVNRDRRPGPAARRPDR